MATRKNSYQSKTVSVTTSVTPILKNNPRRKAFIIFNAGTDTCEVSANSHVAYGQGIPIVTGATLDDDHFNPQGELYGICPTSTADLRILEVISEV